MKKFFRIIILLCFSLLLAEICIKGAPLLMAEEKKKQADVKEAPSAQPQVVVNTSNGRRVVYRVEVADTPRERAIGLMFRESLPPDQGMIFLFPVEEQQSFWMKDTFIALDMIFIRDDLSILGVVQFAKPFDESSHYVVGKSRYVLEVNGGETKKWGFAPGDKVEFMNIDKNAAIN